MAPPVQYVANPFISVNEFITTGSSTVVIDYSSCTGNWTPSSSPQIDVAGIDVSTEATEEKNRKGIKGVTRLITGPFYGDFQLRVVLDDDSHDCEFHVRVRPRFVLSWMEARYTIEEQAPRAVRALFNTLAVDAYACVAVGDFPGLVHKLFNGPPTSEESCYAEQIHHAGAQQE